ncbi:hypothetical protein ABZW18_15355 [Streptomyces sp. NPDC004647]|uniref:hypothetical protein n=1 Tax=Streptomyces sp. NPDC004647 TaxID=3154671 RepID=UPI0033A2F950
MNAAGAVWLAHSAPQPAGVRRAWANDNLAAIPSRLWDVVEADLRRSLDAMERLGRTGQLGPVLVHPDTQRAWWLVTRGAEQQLADWATLTVRPTGWLLHCPPLDRPVSGRGWLEKPDGSGRLTDPAALGAAFGPGGRLPAEAFG